MQRKVVLFLALYNPLTAKYHNNRNHQILSGRIAASLDRTLPEIWFSRAMAIFQLSLFSKQKMNYFIMIQLLKILYKFVIIYRRYILGNISYVSKKVQKSIPHRIISFSVASNYSLQTQYKVISQDENRFCPQHMCCFCVKKNDHKSQQNMPIFIT